MRLFEPIFRHLLVGEWELIPGLLLLYRDGIAPLSLVWSLLFFLQSVRRSVSLSLMIIYENLATDTK